MPFCNAIAMTLFVLFVCLPVCSSTRVALLLSAGAKGLYKTQESNAKSQNAKVTPKKYLLVFCSRIVEAFHTPCNNKCLFLSLSGGQDTKIGEYRELL